MNVSAFIQALRDAGVTHVVGLPDTETGPVFDALAESESPRLVPVCREGEAIAIAAGLWAGGKHPVVLIQSTGLFESGDSLRNVAFELDAPVNLIVGYRGHSGKPNAGAPDTARRFLEPILNAWEVPYEMVADETYRELAESLRRAADRDAGRT